MKANKILLALLVVLAFASIYSLVVITRLRADQRDMVQQVLEKDKIAKEWIDKEGRTHQKLQLKEMSSQAVEMKYRSEIDSLTRLYNIKPRQIKTVKTIVSEKHDTVNINMVKWLSSCDSLAVPILWSDEYTVISGELTKQALSLEYISSDTLKVVEYSKGRWWWKKRYIDVFNSNPRNRVESLTNISVSDTKRTSRISLGPYVGYGYNGSNWDVSVGFAIQFSLIKF